MSATENKDESGKKSIRDHFRVHPAFQYGIAGLISYFLAGKSYQYHWEYFFQEENGPSADIIDLLFYLIVLLIYLEYMLNACKPTKGIVFITIVLVALSVAYEPLGLIFAALHMVLLLPQRRQQERSNSNEATTPKLQ